MIPGIKETVLKFVDSHERDMFALLEDMVRIQSGTHNKKGVDKLCNLIRKRVETASLRCGVIKARELGDHLVVSTRACETSEKQILVTGHLDTVFPADTAFRNYREDDTYAYGPGVIDMKGGLVTGIYMLESLRHMDMLGNIPVTFVFNSDEEIGSPTSRDIIEREAGRAAFAFVLECGGIDGEIVTGRKGKLGASLTVNGHAGHAAFAGHEKPSAIVALSHKILELEALNSRESDWKVNVGTIMGGTSANSVAAQAKASLDVRFDDVGETDKLKAYIETIARKVTVPGTSTTINWTSERPPMPQTRGNKTLYHLAAEQARSLGTEPREAYRSGVSDANFIANQGVPVIDGLGPEGDKDHSEDEYMIKDSLPRRTKLFILLILESWRLYRHEKRFIHI